MSDEMEKAAGKCRCDEHQMPCYHVGFEDGAQWQAERSQVLVDVLAEALVWCDEMLTARDEMNSKVHCAPVRLSPITERVKQALAKYRGEK